MSLPVKNVFIISDGTGITAETFSHSVLSQFSHTYDFQQIREPFVNSEEKSIEIARKINELAEKDSPPIIFSTLVKEEFVRHIRKSKGVFLDIFGACVKQLEEELDVKSEPTIGRSHLNAGSDAYRNRIEAINFSLTHDDGQFVHGMCVTQIAQLIARATE